MDAGVAIGVSTPYLLTGDDIARMAPDAVVFALSDPNPRVDPFAAGEHAAILATGRSDHPNLITTSRVPGVRPRQLDASTHEITGGCLVAAASALADCVKPRSQRQLHRAERVRPGRCARGSDGDAAGRQARPVLIVSLSRTHKRVFRDDLSSDVREDVGRIVALRIGCLVDRYGDGD